MNCSQYGLDTICFSWIYFNQQLKVKKKSGYLKHNPCLWQCVTHNDFLFQLKLYSWCYSTDDYLYTFSFSQTEIAADEITVVMRAVWYIIFSLLAVAKIFKVYALASFWPLSETKCKNNVDIEIKTAWLLAVNMLRWSKFYLGCETASHKAVLISITTLFINTIAFSLILNTFQ